MQSQAAQAHTRVSATAGPIPAGCCLLHHCAYMPDMIRGCLHLLASFCASLPASLVFSAAFSTRPPAQNRSLQSDVESMSSMCEGYISSLTQAQLDEGAALECSTTAAAGSYCGKTAGGLIFCSLTMQKACQSCCKEAAGWLTYCSVRCELMADLAVAVQGAVSVSLLLNLAPCNPESCWVPSTYTSCVERSSGVGSTWHACVQ